MSNAQTAAELGQAKLQFLRIGLRALVRAHSPEDLIVVLREVLDDQAIEYARRTGDYDRAGEMRLASTFLDGFEKFVDNYDPTVE